MIKRKVNWLLIRNIVAFWFFGLCNNYGYVIMLSAAEDIMSEQKGHYQPNSTDTCLDYLGADRHCTSKSTGAVLIADNLPSLICKLTFPFFMHRIPFGFRHALVCCLQASSYLIVAFSTDVAMSLTGVAIGSLASGIGEITYLGLSSFFPPSAIAAWSSGTGAAGLIGSFAFAFLTEPSMGNLSPKVALLIQSFIPAVFLVIYYLVLSPPDEVYTPGWNPVTWIVPADHDTRSFETHEGTEYQPRNVQRVPQRKLTFEDRVILVKPLIHLMVPVSFVYIGEYLINQGLTQMIIFNCHRGFGLSISSQYRWYQVLYQLGVFLSRSSVRLFELPQWVLYLLPILQFSNMFLFLFEAIYWFIPHIAIIFALIIFEGLLGGSSYVNTFNRIHKTVEPDIREYCLSIATLGDSIGVNLAGFAAIPLHNWVCGMKPPTHNL